MKYKKRYFLLLLKGIKKEGTKDVIFGTINRMEPLLSIRANVRIHENLTKEIGGDTLCVISVKNEWKEEVIFLLSLIGKFYKSNMLTLRNSGNIKKIISEENNNASTR